MNFLLTSSSNIRKNQFVKFFSLAWKSYILFIVNRATTTKNSTKYSNKHILIATSSWHPFIFCSAPYNCCKRKSILSFSETLYKVFTNIYTYVYVLFCFRFNFSICFFLSSPFNSQLCCYLYTCLNFVSRPTLFLHKCMLWNSVCYVICQKFIKKSLFCYLTSFYCSYFIFTHWYYS